MSEPSIVLDLMLMDKEKISQIEGVLKIITTAPNNEPLHSQGFSPLDTEVPNEGKISTKWSIRQNVDIETIINAINN